MKIEFVCKTEFTPEQIILLPKNPEIPEIDLLGTCNVPITVRNIIRELCLENGISESEFEKMFYEEDSDYKDRESTFKFRLYFREHEFIFDCQDWTYSSKKEEYKKVFEKYLKMTSEEI
jgi:hypothetical protein